MSLSPAPVSTATPAPPADGSARAPRQQAGSSRRRPWLTILIVLAMLAAIVASIARGYYRDGPLEPDAPTGQGSKAVVQVLGDLGVEVEVDRHTADAAEALRMGRTVLVTDPRSLSAPQLESLAAAHEDGAGRLVLVAPDLVTLSYFSSQISPSGAVRTETLIEAGPGCGDLAHQAEALLVPAAEEAIRGAASLYRVSGEGECCFSADQGSLVAEHDGVLVLGSADLLTNDAVGRADNSALVLNSLSSEGALSWYVPSANDPMGSTSQTLLGYLPDWAGPLLLWLLLIATVALVALGRRFGPVVVEPLPVTVRPQHCAQRLHPGSRAVSVCAASPPSTVCWQRSRRMWAAPPSSCARCSDPGPSPVTRTSCASHMTSTISRRRSTDDRPHCGCCPASRTRRH